MSKKSKPKIQNTDSAFQRAKNLIKEYAKEIIQIVDYQLPNATTPEQQVEELESLRDLYTRLQEATACIEREMKSPGIVVTESENLNIKGFSYLYQKTYSCGGQIHTVNEYRHDQTGMEFVLIPKGTFDMGDSENEREKPVRSVTISPFLIGKYPVTQGIWEKVMGTNPSHFKGSKKPVETVSWEDCQIFGQKADLCLPTEAEWEYACRSGTISKWYFGDSQEQLGEYAWYTSNSEDQTHPVGTKKPNAFGLYDIIGNVWEWCQDWYGNYSSMGKDDPVVDNTSSYRVFRGGSYSYDPQYCRSAYRINYEPGYRIINLGFRCVKPLVGI